MSGVRGVLNYAGCFAGAVGSLDRVNVLCYGNGSVMEMEVDDFGGGVNLPLASSIYS